MYNGTVEIERQSPRNVSYRCLEMHVSEKYIEMNIGILKYLQVTRKNIDGSKLRFEFRKVLQH